MNTIPCVSPGLSLEMKIADELSIEMTAPPGWVAEAHNRSWSFALQYRKDFSLLALVHQRIQHLLLSEEDVFGGEIW